jgi:hypothetical protein
MKSVLIALAAISLATASSASAKSKAEIELETYRTAERIAQAHLKTFDTLDFDVFSNQRWDRLHESHAKDVAVHWPDGHTTHGIDRHIADLKYMFTYAPDTRIKVHPVRIGDKDWTAVVGVMEGTFTKPMTTADGKVIQPTGKAFKLPMATVSHWNRDGVMSEEYLFWDNQTYLQQIGLGN